MYSSLFANFSMEGEGGGDMLMAATKTIEEYGRSEMIIGQLELWSR